MSAARVREPWWGGDAIGPVPTANAWPTPSYAFNRAKVGVGSRHDNQSGSPTRLVVKLMVGVVEPHLFFMSVVTNYKEISCVIDTGADESVFGYEAAQQLGFVPPDSEAGKPDPNTYESDKENGYAFFEPAILADGSCRDAWWCYRNVGIELGGSDLSVRVRFALTLQNTPDGGLVFDWDRSSFQQNLLGMADLLSARMLCVTPEALFMLARIGT